MTDPTALGTASRAPKTAASMALARANGSAWPAPDDPETGIAMTDTEATVDPDAITDLSQVRWTARRLGGAGWFVIGEVGNDPDPNVREFFDLHVRYAHDGDGGDCSPWLADMVARKLAAETLDDAIDTVERDAYARGFDAGERSANQSAALAATIRKQQSQDRDAELRWDLGCALGWGLPEDPADEMTESPTWSEIIAAVRAMREERPAVSPEVVAAAFDTKAPDYAIDDESRWTPTLILEKLAEHGLKVVRT